MKILIVDDNKMNLKIAGKLLEKEPCDLYFSENGADAINELKKTYDLVFMDIMMPIMDGVETLKNIKKINIHSRILTSFFLVKVI